MMELGRAEEIIRRGLAASKAEHTEVLFFERASALTRYSNSIIHQNVAEDNATLSFRLVNEGRTGVASTNKVDEDSIRAAIAHADAFSSAQRPDPNFKGLPRPRSAPERQARYESTAIFGPEERADGVKAVIAKAKEADLSAAGVFATSTTTVGIGNSNGVMQLGELTEAQLTALASGPDSSGYAEDLASDVTLINPGRIASVAIEKALVSAKPKPVDPGSWTVILQPPAVADMLGFLSYVGFGAKAVQEKRSFMSDKFGTKIMGENVTIYDDGLDPRTLSLGFDFEGVPKQKVMLIEHGIAKGAVYDWQTAAMEGRESTGHGLPAPNTHGPIATNLFLEAGDATLEDMIASTERGILVTRFHYTNIEHPLKTTFTGMTRDGTLLIENGKVTGGVRNMRFTQSITEALSRVEMISAATQLCDSFMGAFLVPTIKVSDFNFTGATEF